VAGGYSNDVHVTVDDPAVSFLATFVQVPGLVLLRDPEGYIRFLRLVLGTHSALIYAFGCPLPDNAVVQGLTHWHFLLAAQSLTSADRPDR
jgi:hypothetical protein